MTATRELQQAFKSARDAGSYLITFPFLSLRTKSLEAKIYSGSRLAPQRNTKSLHVDHGCSRARFDFGQGQLAQDEDLCSSLAMER